MYEDSIANIEMTFQKIIFYSLCKFKPTLQLILKNSSHPILHVHYYITEPYGIGKRLSSVCQW